MVKNIVEMHNMPIKDIKDVFNGKSTKNSANGKALCKIPLDFFLLPEAEIMQKMNTCPTGLTILMAEERLHDFGPNTPTIKEKFIFIKDILRRIWNPLVVLLFIICAVSFLMDDLRSVIVVGCMIFLSVFLGYIQERRSVMASEKLQKLVQASASVLRGGKETLISIEEVVPGDIVLLTAGSIIPAD